MLWNNANIDQNMEYCKKRFKKIPRKIYLYFNQTMFSNYFI